MNLPEARFIVLDGVEGCGKSTQARLLTDGLIEQGVPVVLTHEPGGTAIGEAVRALLLDTAYDGMHELTETFLFCAARAQHVLETIRPALEAGKIVACDRFASSTYVYQGYAGGIGPTTVTALNDLATGGLQPDLVIILDLDPEVGRRRKRGYREDRIERKPLDFHQAVRDGFLDYAARLGDRAVVLDADLAPAALAERILAQVWEHNAG